MTVADDFWTLLDETLADLGAADFVGLREVYVSSGLYSPWSRDHEAMDELHMRIAAQRWEEALTLAEDLAHAEPLDVQLRLHLAKIHAGLGDHYEAADQRRFANGLIRAVLRTGDGDSPATAIRVLDTREQAFVLTALDLRSLHSALSVEGERWIDRVEATGPRGPRVLHFDVTLPQRWLSGSVG